MYEFVALGSACEICKALDGKHFKVKDMMPGTNAPPMHQNCRCSVSAWENSEEYEKWLDGYKDRELSFEDRKNKHNGKSVELPGKLMQSKIVPDDIKQLISETVDNISKTYNIDMNNIEFAPHYDNPKAPFTFMPYEEKGKYRAKLNINELFD